MHALASWPPASLPPAESRRGCRPGEACSRLITPSVRSSDGGLTSVTLPEEGIDLGAYIGNIERELIALSLERTNGNKGQAARLLNLNRTTLVEKLKRLAR